MSIGIHCMIVQDEYNIKIIRSVIFSILSCFYHSCKKKRKKKEKKRRQRKKYISLPELIWFLSL